MPTLYTHPAKIMFALALGSLSQIGIKLIKHATFLRPPVNHGLNGSPIQHGELSPPKAGPKDFMTAKIPPSRPFVKLRQETHSHVDDLRTPGCRDGRVDSHLDMGQFILW